MNKTKICLIFDPKQSYRYIYETNNIKYTNYCIDIFLPKILYKKDFIVVDWFIKKINLFENVKIELNQDLIDKIIKSIQRDKNFYKGNILTNSKIIFKKIEDMKKEKYLDFVQLFEKFDITNKYDEIIVCNTICKICKFSIPLKRRLYVNF